jgi:hypothetical protein
MTPAELTALLAPVRAELEWALRRDDSGYYRSRGHLIDGLTKARAALDKLTPPAPAELDPMVVLGIAALGLLKELRTARTGVDIEDMVYAPERSADWRARADALLAAAYPKGTG